MRHSIQIFPDLTIRIGEARVRITPRDSMHLAERLIRAATKRMVIEEAEQPTRQAQPNGHARDV